MESKDIYMDYLAHHGVKGMKWGVRHDQQRVGRYSNSSVYRSNSYKKKRNKYDFKLSKGTKVALAVTGIGAGTFVALTLMRSGKIHADDIMKAGTKIQTLHHHPDIITKGEKFYTTNKFVDKQKYMARFSINHEGVKKKVTATVSKDIKIAGGNTGKKVYQELRKSNEMFKADTDFYGDNYLAFNREHLLGPADDATKCFIGELKKRGYDGVADLNDRGGWRTSANILFDNSKLGSISVNDIKPKEIAGAKAMVGANDLIRGFVNEPYAIVVTAGGGAVSSFKITEDKQINDRINRGNRRK